ncbi:hypothetical protein [Cupriavidus basilensis]|uniref:hypothetical protein n=1 Tax=Cupriavidus basilensis TaxID=68895 RepID=UPI00157ADDC4|nr:hypothetical protein [Cupriavidus basilensis]NUA29222.1 hypothetical protein [Cupriavidus basilensis]
MANSYLVRSHIVAIEHLNWPFGISEAVNESRVIRRKTIQDKPANRGFIRWIIWDGLGADMKIGKPIFGFVVLVVFAFSLSKTSVRAKERETLGEIHESPYVVPFPLARGGERIDAVIRVAKSGYHYFNLVFVEGTDWPEQKKDELMRVFRGWALLDEFNSQQHYPIKLRFKLNSIDGKTNVHIDEVIAKRGERGYLTSYIGRRGNRRRCDVWRRRRRPDAGRTWQ